MMLGYLKGSLNLVLTLSADSTNIIKWWPDSAFAAHKDFKSNTGGTMLVGKGPIYSTSKKQKIMTKSSTEAEIVETADVLPQQLWTGRFLGAQ
eukprot:2074159-Ditylum_brightwellii.AAC.1